MHFALWRSKMLDVRSGKVRRMSNLADAIERYLRQMLSEQETLEVQRRQLALLFRCAPSQINYVLETRFTPARGYVIESRRGGGGFIRISRLPDGSLAADLGERIDLADVPALLTEMSRQGVITRREAHFLQEALGEALAGTELDPGVVRARLLRAMLTLLGGRGR